MTLPSNLQADPPTRLLPNGTPIRSSAPQYQARPGSAGLLPKDRRRAGSAKKPSTAADVTAKRVKGRVNIPERPKSAFIRGYRAMGLPPAVSDGARFVDLNGSSLRVQETELPDVSVVLQDMKKKWKNEDVMEETESADDGTKVKITTPVDEEEKGKAEADETQNPKDMSSWSQHEVGEGGDAGNGGSPRDSPINVAIPVIPSLHVTSPKEDVEKQETILKMHRRASIEGLANEFENREAEKTKSYSKVGKRLRTALTESAELPARDSVESDDDGNSTIRGRRAEIGGQDKSQDITTSIDEPEIRDLQPDGPQYQLQGKKGSEFRFRIKAPDSIQAILVFEVKGDAQSFFGRSMDSMWRCHNNRFELHPEDPRSSADHTYVSYVRLQYQASVVVSASMMHYLPPTRPIITNLVREEQYQTVMNTITNYYMIPKASHQEVVSISLRLPTGEGQLFASESVCYPDPTNATWSTNRSSKVELNIYPTDRLSHVMGSIFICLQTCRTPQRIELSYTTSTHMEVCGTNGSKTVLIHAGKVKFFKMPRIDKGTTALAIQIDSPDSFVDTYVDVNNQNPSRFAHKWKSIRSRKQLIHLDPRNGDVRSNDMITAGIYAEKNSYVSVKANILPLPPLVLAEDTKAGTVDKGRMSFFRFEVAGNGRAASEDKGLTDLKVTVASGSIALFVSQGTMFPTPDDHEFHIKAPEQSEIRMALAPGNDAYVGVIGVEQSTYAITPIPAVRGGSLLLEEAVPHSGYVALSTHLFYKIFLPEESRHKAVRLCCVVNSGEAVMYVSDTHAHPTAQKHTWKWDVKEALEVVIDSMEFSKTFHGSLFVSLAQKDSNVKRRVNADKGNTRGAFTTIAFELVENVTPLDILVPQDGEFTPQIGANYRVIVPDGTKSMCICVESEAFHNLSVGGKESNSRAHHSVITTYQDGRWQENVNGDQVCNISITSRRSGKFAIFATVAQCLPIQLNSGIPHFGTITPDTPQIFCINLDKASNSVGFVIKVESGMAVNAYISNKGLPCPTYYMWSAHINTKERTELFITPSDSYFKTGKYFLLLSTSFIHKEDPIEPEITFEYQEIVSGFELSTNKPLAGEMAKKSSLVFDSSQSTVRSSKEPEMESQFTLFGIIRPPVKKDTPKAGPARASISSNFSSPMAVKGIGSRVNYFAERKVAKGTAQGGRSPKFQDRMDQKKGIENIIVKRMEKYRSANVKPSTSIQRAYNYQSKSLG